MEITIFVKPNEPSRTLIYDETGTNLFTNRILS